MIFMKKNIFLWYGIFRNGNHSGQKFTLLKTHLFNTICKTITIVFNKSKTFANETNNKCMKKYDKDKESTSIY